MIWHCQQAWIPTPGLPFLHGYNKAYLTRLPRALNEITHEAPSILPPLGREEQQLRDRAEVQRTTLRRKPWSLPNSPPPPPLLAVSISHVFSFYLHSSLIIHVSLFPFFWWGNWGSEKWRTLRKVMDLVKDLGRVLSDSKAIPLPHRAPCIMSVWLKNEKELMEWPFHYSFHYFTWWMTNKQTLPEGICILKEELINPNESLIGGVCGGDLSDHWGFLLCLQGAWLSCSLSIDYQLFWNQKYVVECRHILLVCPKCHRMNWWGGGWGGCCCGKIARK